MAIDWAPQLDGAAGLSAPQKSHERATDSGRGSCAAATVTVPVSEHPPAPLLPCMSTELLFDLISTTEEPVLSPITFTFLRIPEPKTPLFFTLTPVGHHTATPSLKRPRPSSDVDGPLTATVGIKKRRLQLHLATSRLSRPFSLPATYIPSLEASVMTPGPDRACPGMMARRFFKLAAAAAARRLACVPGLQIQTHHLARTGAGGPSAAEAFRRAVLANSYRLRVVAVAAQGGGGMGMGMGCPSLLVADARADGGGVERMPVAPPTPLVCLGSCAATAEVVVAAAAEMVVVRKTWDEDEDVAFPTSRHESRYESCAEVDGLDELGEPDHDVYTDFSVMFGGGDEDEEGDDGGDDVFGLGRELW